ncbi:MAG: hypothetical protein V4787_26585, partial [Pseudomonadota bacterium]
HRLLDGAVSAGIEAEGELKALGYKVDLGSQISAKSPLTLFGWKVRSKQKMDIFYLMLLIPLLIVAICLAFAIRPQPAAASQATLANSAACSAQVPASSVVPAGLKASAASQQASAAVRAASGTQVARRAVAQPPKAPASVAQVPSRQGDTPKRKSNCPADAT